MWSRRRFNSDAVSVLLHLRRLTATTARVWSHSVCLLWNMLTRGFIETCLINPSFLQPTLRLNLILEIAKAACSGIVCERTIFTGVRRFIS